MTRKKMSGHRVFLAIKEEKWEVWKMEEGYKMNMTEREMWTTVSKGFEQVFMCFLGPLQRGTHWQIGFFLNNNFKTQLK